MVRLAYWWYDDEDGDRVSFDIGLRNGIYEYTLLLCTVLVLLPRGLLWKKIEKLAVEGECEEQD